MGQKDIMQKNFEAYNDVFSDIVNGTLFDGREVIKPEALVDAIRIANMLKLVVNFSKKRRQSICVKY